MEQIATTDFNQPESTIKGLRINLRLVNKVLGCLVIASFIYFLTGTNDLAVKGFAIRDLKAQSVQLHQENVNLEIKTTTLGSYIELGERVAQLDLIAAEDIKYVSADAPVVAKK